MRTLQRKRVGAARAVGGRGLVLVGVGVDSGHSGRSRHSGPSGRVDGESHPPCPNDPYETSLQLCARQAFLAKTQGCLGQRRQARQEERAGKADVRATLPYPNNLYATSRRSLRLCERLLCARLLLAAATPASSFSVLPDAAFVSVRASGSPALPCAFGLVAWPVWPAPPFGLQKGMLLWPHNPFVLCL